MRLFLSSPAAGESLSVPADRPSLRWRFPLIWAVLAAWFLYFAWPGLLAWFTPDDLMNLHGVAFLDPAQIAAAKERPAANLLLKGLWELFGLHPRPYRVFCFGLLLANLWLALRLFWRASGSWKTALFGGLFFAYHAQLQDLYFSTGTLYDLVCFTFFSLALLLYLAEIGAHGFSARRTAIVTSLAALAAGSKEVAAALPLLLAIAALVFRADRLAWRTAALAAASRWAVPAWTLWRAPLGDNPAYRHELSLAVLSARWNLLTGDLLYQGPDWSPAAAWSLLALAVLAAAWIRRPAAWLALGLITLTPLPLLFLPQRSFYAFYIPYAGWCLLAGLALDRLAGRIPLRHWLVPALLRRTGGPAGAATPLAVGMDPRAPLRALGKQSGGCGQCAAPESAPAASRRGDLFRR